ncbi:hypothetical protein Tco_1248122 [Tanacetum coccineum]
MDSIISLRQKNTLAEYMILFGADNRPPMLDKDLYDSWKCRMELYMQNREHGRMILKSVEHSPIIWPTVEENGVIRTKKYAELSATEKIHADCVMKATNIILQGLPADIYSLERECKLYDAFDKFTHIKGESLHTFDVPVFSPGDDPIACLNKAMAFLTVVASSRGDKGKVILTEGSNTYDSVCDDISNAKEVLMANISNYGSDVIFKVPHSETYLNDMENQGVQTIQDFEQPPAVDFTDNEIHSDSNIIPYSQYLQETQQANVQDTHL